MTLPWRKRSVNHWEGRTFPVWLIGRRILVMMRMASRFLACSGSTSKKDVLGQRMHQTFRIELMASSREWEVVISRTLQLRRRTWQTCCGVHLQQKDFIEANHWRKILQCKRRLLKRVKSSQDTSMTLRKAASSSPKFCLQWTKGDISLSLHGIKREVSRRS